MTINKKEESLKMNNSSLDFQVVHAEGNFIC
ncbi:hypothetical protein J2Z83_002800 [Virgibacillus natechei]|uniref:Uncharacterized protein n=1 Tax=Virgibacillus natechei TaxID=1216297 RepID=A0ABS4II98_9BACI|nr:hypothetical protein [Virgibacillus natechei]